ncbi:phosphoenolpyruvate synthase [Flavobacterium gawalongense]|uniref:Phosphoenolpyruvate synthase n=1 Tax=Flavobacterium gawalongense TaxID=2594432 RepID=A0A553BRD9_9FLAO|nr:phosphoenolpyruvate synthase [Flavobacterium gawalongense]TRX10811.1 phosphoenolpyruvate synthase [Flavobacterium gawalongense]TRX11533.1 phosphoenolpyruvate synthase [Flavobacterium gawalongense]TRX29303.1 phosphoenolpyruvate synthase [Flavobacterium gawalongense]
MAKYKHILFFDQIGIEAIGKVGGKNASLGEMYNQLNPIGISIPNGFAITAEAYRIFRKTNNLEKPLKDLLFSLDTKKYSNLSSIGEKARNLILSAVIPSAIRDEIDTAYQSLSEQCGINNLDVAVRSSATSEDLPTASFAGQMQSFLNINGKEQLIDAVHRCYVSLFTDRAIKYRHDMGFAKLDIAISVGIQQMVRSDKAAAGVAFTIDPDSGFENTIIINSIWGLGENIVQGTVTPDEWVVFKPTLENTDLDPILKRQCGRKEFTMIYADKSTGSSAENTIVNTDTSLEKQNQFSLSDKEVIQLSQWCYKIEKHYKKAMDIEWAKDGLNNQLYIVQARPETVHGKANKQVREIYKLKEKGRLLTQGIALGDKIASGKVRILNSPQEGHLLQNGEIIVTDLTNPDWDPIMKRASAIITNKGGRTSHAAIVARELGTVAVVGCGNATSTIKNGQEITVSCAEGTAGNIYDGQLKWEITEQDFSKLEMPKTDPMLILADPERAFELSHYPNQGVGLMRMEFAISNTIKIHPLALCEPEKITDENIVAEIAALTKGYEDPKIYFVDKLAEAVSIVAAAFYPKDVIVRMSDFKSNEYANLIGGKYYEPDEENPMIGFRGASRYYSDFYRKGFALECEAMKKVRNEMGLHNVKLMIPFCRTFEEGENVLNEMAKNGLVQGVNGLEVYVMIEIPSNVLMADEYAKLFDGFSIGSNDLTQLTLGLDRDSALVSYLFDEENPAIKYLIKETIRVAKRFEIKVGLCGQAPSDIPEFAKFLVNEGIDSISFNPDALIKGIENILEAEKKTKRKILM